MGTTVDIRSLNSTHVPHLTERHLARARVAISISAMRASQLGIGIGLHQSCVRSLNNNIKIFQILSDPWPLLILDIG